MATMLSLFDGSGGFPLAGALCGITPKYASEVEPYYAGFMKNPVVLLIMLVIGTMLTVLLSED